MSLDQQEPPQAGATVIKRSGTTAGERLEKARDNLPTRSKTSATSKVKEGPLCERYPIKDKGEIRLVKLVKTSGILCFRMKVVRLDDEPAYKAASYEWGPKDQQGGYKIMIQGQPNYVRKNLMEFLLKLRDHDPNVFSYWMFIDQLCIDQGIYDERSFQASQMGRVYSQAEEVMAWVGPSTPDDEEAIKAMQSGEEAYLLRGSKAGSLFEKPYWNRVWIVQEVLLAKKLVILCGARRIELDTLLQFIERSKVKWNVPSLLKKRSEGIKSFDLRTAISKFVRYECQLPQDKVYGLTGLIEPSQRIEVDYTKNKMEVLTDLLNALLKVHYETTSGKPFVDYKRSYTLFDGYSPEALAYDGGVDPIIMAAYFIGGFELKYMAWRINEMVKQKEGSRALFTVEEVNSLNAKPTSSWKRLSYLLK